MKKPDIFDPSKRYVFNNWSEEDFEFRYANPDFQFIPPPDASDYTQKELKRMYEAEFKKNYFKTIVVPKGGIVEVPEWLAFLMCKHFVDREFTKAVEKKYGSLSIAKNGGNKNDKAESEMLNLNSPNAREELEEATIRLISATEESPIIAQIREQIRQEERAKLMKKAEAELEIQAVEATAPKSAPKVNEPVISKEFAEANE